MQPIILWMVMVGTGTCSGRIEYLTHTMAVYDLVWMSELSAWKKAISISDYSPCLSVSVKKLYAYAEPQKKP